MGDLLNNQRHGRPPTDAKFFQSLSHSNSNNISKANSNTATIEQVSSQSFAHKKQPPPLRPKSSTKLHKNLAQVKSQKQFLSNQKGYHQTQLSASSSTTGGIAAALV